MVSTAVKDEKSQKEQPKTEPEEKPEVKPKTLEEKVLDLDKLLGETMMELEITNEAIEGIKSSVNDIQGLLIKLSTVQAVAKGAAKFGTHREAVKVLDTKTGELYGSKSACGKACAAEYGLDPSDNFIYYQMVKVAEGRFEEQS